MTILKCLDNVFLIPKGLHAQIAKAEFSGSFWVNGVFSETSSCSHRHVELGRPPRTTQQQTLYREDIWRIHPNRIHGCSEVSFCFNTELLYTCLRGRIPAPKPQQQQQQYLFSAWAWLPPAVNHTTLPPPRARSSSAPLLGEATSPAVQPADKTWPSQCHDLHGIHPVC